MIFNCWSAVRRLPSSGNDPVTLTAVVRDSNNNVVKGANVNFSATDGNIQVTRGTTDETGTATAIFSITGNKTNRTITINATVADLPPSTANINVVGTTIDIAGPNSVVLGNTIPLTLTLKDSAGTGIAGQTLNVTSANFDISNPMPVTGRNGEVEIEVTAKKDGVGSVGVEWSESIGTVESYDIIVSLDSFVFITPLENASIDLRLETPVILEWTTVSSSPVAGRLIDFKTTRGIFVSGLVEETSLSASTNPQGQATVNIKSDFAGPAIITAVSDDGTVSAQRNVVFIAKEVHDIIVQADPATMGTNPPGGDSEKSTITVLVLDPNDNPVQNQTVDFTIVQDVTGGGLSPASATTDATGRASVTYKAGSTPSSENGVIIKAAVRNTTVSDVVNLTVARKQVFINLGTGNTVSESADLTRYLLPYSVLVNDIVGAPVSEALVTLDVVPSRYYKGYYTWNGTVWERNITAGPCINEDLNRNGLLDGGEDYNGNRRLDPGNVATVSTSSVTTDASGFGLFDVIYAQEYANWTDVDLVAKTKVAGTEAEETASFSLDGFADDFNKEDTSPPGQPSPFGNSFSCNDDRLLVVDPNLVVISPGATQQVRLNLTNYDIPEADVAVAAIVNAPSGMTVNATGGTTDSNGILSSDITVSSGVSGNIATVRYLATGAETIVTVIVP